jgi:hypothetical protein
MEVSGAQKKTRGMVSEIFPTTIYCPDTVPGAGMLISGGFFLLLDSSVTEQYVD